jgi:hypothetical protein
MVRHASAERVRGAILQPRGRIRWPLGAAPEPGRRQVAAASPTWQGVRWWSLGGSFQRREALGEGRLRRPTCPRRGPGVRRTWYRLGRWRGVGSGEQVRPRGLQSRVSAAVARVMICFGALVVVSARDGIEMVKPRLPFCTNMVP